MPIELDIPPTSKQKRSIEEIRQLVIGKIQYRNIVEIRSDTIDKENKTVEMSFSSETPVDRFYGYEILSHKPGAIKMDRAANGLPFLHNHNSDEQVGRCENFRCEDNKTRALVRFSRSQAGQDIFNDFADGIRKETSIGYAVHSYREMKPEEMSPDLQRMCLENKCGAYLADSWEPLEGSNAPVPADPSVGAGRSLEINLKDNISADKSVGVGGDQIQSQQKERAIKMPIELQTPTPEDLARHEQERVAELTAIGTRFADRIGGKEKMDVLVKDAIDLKRTAEQFRGTVYMRVTDDKPLETPASFLDLSERDKKEFSIVRAIRQCVDGKGGEYEAEVSAAVAKKVGDSKRGGIYLPYDIQKRPMDIPANVQRQLNDVLRRNGINTRTLSVGSATAGGDLVGTQIRPQDFIELLRNALIQGFTFLTGLQQNVDIPSQTGGATMYVASSEGATFTETDQVFGQLTLSPHDIGAYTEITCRLLIQSTPAVDALVASDLILQLARKINYEALFGDGQSGHPYGAFHTSGIPTPSAATLTWAEALAFASDIGHANVVGKLEWLMNSASKAVCLGRVKVSGFPVFIMNDDGTMAGHDAQISEQMPDDYLALGKWDEVVVGEFGTMEVLYDRNSLSTSGGLRIAIYHSIDAGLRHAGAVAVASDLS